MRVLHVIPSLSLVHGGPSEAIRLMEEALLAQGVSSETCTTTDDGPRRHVDRVLGVRVMEEGRYRWYFRKSTDFYKCSWPFLHWIGRHVRDYDLLHIHALFSFTSTAAARAARRAGIPYIVRPLGTLSPYGLQARRPILKRLSVRCLEGPTISAAAAVHFTSDAERHEVESLGFPMRSVVIPLAVRSPEPGGPDVLSECLPELREKTLVLFMSRLDPKKNVEGLLQAFALIAAKYPRAQLVLAGAGEEAYAARLRALGDSLGLGPRVTWVGHVQGALKSNLLSDASIFVLPSFAENFGIAVAEALAAGVACVVGEGVALSDEIEHAGAGIKVGTSAEAIAHAVDRLLGDGALRARMSENAGELARAQFSIGVMGERLRALYESILGTRRLAA